jgi:hypothetical protein
VTSRLEVIMAIEMFSYSQLGERLNCSPEAARALVRRLRLPRHKANDGKALVSVDLTEINHKAMPARSPADRHPIAASIKANIDALQVGLAKLDALVACNRSEFERERDRLEQLSVDLLRTTLDAQNAKEAVVRLEGELKALRSRPWWRRLVA